MSVQLAGGTKAEGGGGRALVSLNTMLMSAFCPEMVAFSKMEAI